MHRPDEPAPDALQDPLQTYEILGVLHHMRQSEFARTCQRLSDGSLDALPAATMSGMSRKGSVNVTHWNNASGPPVSGGGGGGSSNYSDYMRGVHEAQEFLRRIGAGSDGAAERVMERHMAARDETARMIDVTALGDKERLFIPGDDRDQKRAQPDAERTCSACHIGEFSRIGAGPFTGGLCRYCAELKSLEPVVRRIEIPPDQPAARWAERHPLAGELVFKLVVFVIVVSVIIGVQEMIRALGG